MQISDIRQTQHHPPPGLTSSGKMGELFDVFHVLTGNIAGTFRRTRPVCSAVLCYSHWAKSFKETSFPWNSKYPLIPRYTYPFFYCLFQFRWEDTNPSRGFLVCFTFGLESFNNYIPAFIATNLLFVEFFLFVFHVHIFGE
jgi:hypothetical protein